METYSYNRAAKSCIILISISLLMMACSSKTKVESDLHIKGAPDWVNEGTNILKNKNGRLFHGVGIAPPMGDMSLQSSTADDRARAALAKVLSSYMDVLSQDYTASHDLDGQLEQSVSRQIDNMTRVNLAGARIIGRWRDKKTNVIYALAEMDMKYLKETLGQVQDMNEDLKGFIHRQGDNTFDRMVEER